MQLAMNISHKLTYIGMTACTGIHKSWLIAENLPRETDLQSRSVENESLLKKKKKKVSFSHKVNNKFLQCNNLFQWLLHYYAQTYACLHSSFLPSWHSDNLTYRVITKTPEQADPCPADYIWSCCWRRKDEKAYHTFNTTSLKAVGKDRLQERRPGRLWKKKCQNVLDVLFLLI